MLGVSLFRIVRTALQNFWRNVWLSVATTTIMILTVLMVSFLYFANVFGAEVLRSIERKVDLTVTFKENVQDDYIAAIGQELEARRDVDSVRIVSSDEARDQLLRKHSDNPVIEESFQELGNPLPASLFVVATEPRFYESIATALEAEKYEPFIDKVNFENTRDVIDKLIRGISSIKTAAFIITVTFAVLVMLIMFNTVRLAIYGFREEIDIMRLVGASRWFIQGPFIFEAILVALLAVIISTALLYPTLSAISPKLSQAFFSAQSEPFDLYAYGVANWMTVVGLQLLTAVGLAIISSAVAVRRYLKD